MFDFFGKERAGLRAQIVSLTCEKNDLSRSLDTFEIANKRIAKEYSDLQQNLKRLNSRVSECENQLTSLKEENKTLNAQKEALQSKNADLIEQIDRVSEILGPWAKSLSPKLDLIQKIADGWSIPDVNFPWQ